MDTALAESVGEALKTPWILDCDSTVKPNYGHQAGAEASYNRQKPGRPSHVVHTYRIGKLRLFLDVQVRAAIPMSLSPPRVSTSLTPTAQSG
jgi:hypothetical protein